MKSNLKALGLTVAVDSELFEAGLTEDGEAFVGERYVVVAEDELGNRWRHHKAFSGVEVVDCVDHSFFKDVRPAARDQAYALVDRIVAAGEIDLDRWSESRPAYGSTAYLQYGQDDEIAWERAQA